MKNARPCKGPDKEFALYDKGHPGEMINVGSSYTMELKSFLLPVSEYVHPVSDATTVGLYRVKG